QGNLLASPPASSLNGKLTAKPLQGSDQLRTVVDGHVAPGIATVEPPQAEPESQTVPAENTYPVDRHVPDMVTQ
ncbi:hypothetical protein ACHK7U_01540, partial [Staphylococcus hominis]